MTSNWNCRLESVVVHNAEFVSILQKHFFPNSTLWYFAGTNIANSWTLETKKHHTELLFPDLTARSFEDDKITLKCKGDVTVSSEPDGSILGLARQELSSGSAAMIFFFFFFFILAFFRISYHCLAQSLVRYQWADFLSYVATEILMHLI